MSAGVDVKGRETMRQRQERYENGDVKIFVEQGLFSFEVTVRAINNETPAAFAARLRAEKGFLRLFAMKQIRAMRVAS